MKKHTEFSDKTVLITGAWGGLGITFVRHLLFSGARVILSDRQEKPITELNRAGDLPQGWESQVIGQVAVDLNAADGPEQLFHACQAIAPVDVVIHNAGAAGLGYFEEIPLSEFNFHIRILLTAHMELTHFFIPEFLKRGSGQFIFIDSVAGFVATSLGSSYSAGKFGLRGFAMALSGELKSRGVDVSIIYPFFTRTSIIKAPVFGKARIPRMPRIFINEPDDVIAAALSGAAQKKLHVRTGFYSRFMWHVVRFWPVVSKQMQPDKL